MHIHCCQLVNVTNNRPIEMLVLTDVAYPSCPSNPMKTRIAKVLKSRSSVGFPIGGNSLACHHFPSSLEMRLKCQRRIYINQTQSLQTQILLFAATSFSCKRCGNPFRSNRKPQLKRIIEGLIWLRQPLAGFAHRERKAAHIYGWQMVRYFKTRQ